MKKMKKSKDNKQMEWIEEIVRDYLQETYLIEYTKYPLPGKKIIDSLFPVNEIYLVNFNNKDREILRLASFDQKYLDQLNIGWEEKKGIRFSDDDWAGCIPMSIDWFNNGRDALENFLTQENVDFDSSHGKIEHDGRVTYYISNRINGL